MRTEDGSIIHRCLNGKPEAFGMLVDKYKEGVYAYVYNELRNLHDAQDVTQEVFLQAYRDLRSLRRWESFAFWLHRIAYRRCMDFLRIRSRRADREFIEDQDPKVVDAPSLDSYRRSKLSESVWEALNALPEIYREVLMLHYFGGMTIKDIAIAVGASPGAIKKLNGKIYVVGGGTEGRSQSTVWEYDPITDTWREVADMPTRRASLSSAVVDGKLYAIGGYGPGFVILSTVEEYDPEGLQAVSPQGKLPTMWGEVKAE